jgi:hypothetical protein
VFLVLHLLIDNNNIHNQPHKLVLLSLMLLLLSLMLLLLLLLLLLLPLMLLGRLQELVLLLAF